MSEDEKHEEEKEVVAALPRKPPAWKPRWPDFNIWYAIGGALLGAGYAALEQFLLTTKPPSMSTDVLGVSFPLEAFDAEPDLTPNFAKLQPYARYNLRSYEQALHYCNKILFLERQLSSRLITPSIGDRTDATCFFLLVQSELAALKLACPDNDPSGACIQNKSVAAILSIIKPHMHRIMGLCREVRAADD